MSNLLLLLFLAFKGHVLDEKTAHRAVTLLERTSQLPDVNPALVLPAVAAALEVETPTWRAEVLIGIAWGESRLDPTIRTGRVCGPLQTMRRSAADCDRWRDPVLGFGAGVAELEEWARDRRTHGVVSVILLAHACGSSAFDGSCAKGRWPGWVLRRAERLGYRAS